MPRKKICSFISKLYNILNDDKVKDIITWNSNSSFSIVDKNRLISEILPANFRSHSYNSFIRQLNKYDFRKIRGSNAFKHPCFKRNDIDKLSEIIPKGTYGTFREIKNNKLSLSLFNYTVTKTLEKITFLLESFEKYFYSRASVVNRVLVFEDYEFEEIAEEMKREGYKVKQVYFYSEFERKISSKFYNYLIIDQNFYEIFKRETYDGETMKKLKIIVTWSDKKIGVYSNVFKSLKKPYNFQDLLLIFNNDC